LQFHPTIHRAVEHLAGQRPTQRLIFCPFGIGFAIPCLDLFAACGGGRIVFCQRHALYIKCLGRAGILGLEQDHVGKGGGEVVPALLLAKLVTIKEEVDILLLLLAVDTKLRCSDSLALGEWTKVESLGGIVDDHVR